MERSCSYCSVLANVPPTSRRQGSSPVLLPTRRRVCVYCSVDFQSTVSPIWNQQSVGSVPRAVAPRRLAECNSAIRQTASLRYESLRHGKQTRHRQHTAIEPEARHAPRPFSRLSQRFLPPITTATAIKTSTVRRTASALP